MVRNEGDAKSDVSLGSAQKRRFVTLVENVASSTPTNDDDTLVVGVRVSNKAMKRSSLLAGIKETEGLAALPGRLSPEDVKLWESACVINVDMSSEELVTVLQVADALGDTADQKWVTSLANKALETNWEALETGGADSMLADLLRLPPHLLHRVLSQCISLQHTRARPAYALLDSFPASLHIAITSALMSSSRLSIPTGHASLILRHLPYATAPQAGLRSLTLDCDHTRVNNSAASQGVLLARAAAVHPSITSLSLDRQQPQLLRTFSSSLPNAALPNLADLSIVTHAHPGGCAEVARCLSLLPSLTHLTAKFSLSEIHSEDAPGAPLSGYGYLAANPASLPHLETMSVDEFVEQPTDSRECHGCAHAFMQLLAAPALTHLTVKICPSRTPFSALVPELTSERYPALRRLSVSGALKADVLSHTQRIAASGVAFPAVEEVSVASACPASVRRIGAALCECFSPSLTTLSITLNSEVSGPHDDTCTVRMAQVAWSPFWGTLGSCTGLRKLDLMCLSTPWHSNGVSFSRSLAQALERLTHLTHLQLSCGFGPAGSDMLDVALNGAAFGAALSALTDLRLLLISSGERVLNFDSLQPVLDACASLRRLEEVALCFERVTLAHVRDLAPRLTAATALFLMGAVAEDDSDGFEALASQFPSIDFVLQ